jgi:hypothetical protein
MQSSPHDNVFRDREIVLVAPFLRSAQQAFGKIYEALSVIIRQGEIASTIAESGKISNIFQ